MAGQASFREMSRAHIKPQSLEKQLSNCRKSLEKAEKAGKVSIAESLRKKLQALEAEAGGASSEAVSPQPKAAKANLKEASKSAKGSKKSKVQGQSDSDSDAGGGERQKAIALLLKAHAQAQEDGASDDDVAMQPEASWWKDPELVGAMKGDDEAAAQLSDLAKSMEVKGKTKGTGDDSEDDDNTDDEPDSDGEDFAAPKKAKLSMDLGDFFEMSTAGGGAEESDISDVDDTKEDAGTSTGALSVSRLKKIRRRERKERMLAAKLQWHPSWLAQRKPKVSGAIVGSKGVKTCLDTDPGTALRVRKKMKKKKAKTETLPLPPTDTGVPDCSTPKKRKIKRKVRKDSGVPDSSAPKKRKIKRKVKK